MQPQRTAIAKASEAAIIDASLAKAHLTALHTLVKKHCLLGNNTAVLLLLSSPPLVTNNLFWETCSYKILIAKSLVQHCLENHVRVDAMELYHMLHPLVYPAATTATTAQHERTEEDKGSMGSSAQEDALLIQVLARLYNQGVGPAAGEQPHHGGAGGMSVSQAGPIGSSQQHLPLFGGAGSSRAGSQIQPDQEADSVLVSADAEENASLLEEVFGLLSTHVPRVAVLGAGGGVAAKVAEELRDSPAVVLPQRLQPPPPPPAAAVSSKRGKRSRSAEGGAAAAALATTTTTEADDYHHDGGEEQAQHEEEGVDAVQVEGGETREERQAKAAAAKAKDDEVYAILGTVKPTTTTQAKTTTTSNTVGVSRLTVKGEAKKTQNVAATTTAAAGAGGGGLTATDEREEDADPFDEVPSVINSQNPGAHRVQATASVQHRSKFSVAEDKAILEGLARFAGQYRWQNIFETYKKVWAPGRTAGNLTDHWRQSLRDKALRK